MCLRIKILLLLVLATVMGPRCFAQGKGSISGAVTDTSGSVLQGAQVELQPTGLLVASGDQGLFYVNSLDPGAYTVTIKYVGFGSFTKSIQVTSGQVTRVDASLAVEATTEQVLVTAERASGEAEEINRQITADNVVQVISSDVIRSLPNANMADALGRLPSVTLERDEGEGKYVQVRGTEPRLTSPNFS